MDGDRKKQHSFYNGPVWYSWENRTYCYCLFPTCLIVSFVAAQTTLRVSEKPFLLLFVESTQASDEMYKNKCNQIPTVVLLQNVFLMISRTPTFKYKGGN